MAGRHYGVLLAKLWVQRRICYMASSALRDRVNVNETNKAAGAKGIRRRGEVDELIRNRKKEVQAEVLASGH